MLAVNRRAKMTHFRLWGIGKVFEQCLLCVAVQNMKKITLVVDKKDFLRLLRLLEGLYSPIQAAIFSIMVLPEKIVEIIFSNINPLIIENPA